MYIDPFTPSPEAAPLSKVLADIQHSPSPQLPESVIPHSLGGFRGAFHSLAGRSPTEQEIWAAGIRSWRHLNEKSFKDLPERVAPEHVDALIEEVHYTCIDTLVQCTIHMTSGQIVIGYSRPVSANMFTYAEGKARALKDAKDKIFELEAYVLRTKRFEQGLV